MESRTHLLSQEMQDTGWVTEFDDVDKIWYTYNKKFTDEFYSEPQSENPLISTEVIIVNFENKMSAEVTSELKKDNKGNVYYEIKPNEKTSD